MPSHGKQREARERAYEAYEIRYSLMENRHFPRVTADIMLLRRIGYPAITNITRRSDNFTIYGNCRAVKMRASVNSI